MTAIDTAKAADNDGRDLFDFRNDELRSGIWPSSTPLWLASLYVILTIVRPWEKMIPWLGDLYFERLYALLMIACILFSKRKRFAMTVQTAAVLLFFGALSVSALLAYDRSLAWQQLYELITMIMFYFILVSVMRTPYEVIFVVIAYVLAMTVYLSKAEWEFFVNGEHQYDMGVVRLCGIESTLGGPNALAMSIAASMPLLLFLWTTREEIARNWKKRWRNLYKRGLQLYWVLSISAIFLTNSRTGMVTLALFVLLAAFRGKGFLRKIRYILVGVLFMAILWGVLPMEQKNRLRTIWDPSAGPSTAAVSAQGRIQGFHAGMEMFFRNPLSGVGIGNFIPYRQRSLDGIALNAHNLAGEVLGETGLLGGATFLFMIGVTIFNCRKTNVLARRSPGKTVQVLANLTRACRDSLILLLFTGIFSHNMLRFNWFWLAAFSVMAKTFAMQYAGLTQTRRVNATYGEESPDYA